MKKIARIDLIVENHKIVHLETSLFGRYNVSNILSTCAVALNEGISPEKLAEGVKTFKGMKRRQELVYKNEDIIVIDDYAHHPTAVDLTLRGIRERYPKRRIVACFEPNSATSRSFLFEKPYADVFSSLADTTMFSVLPIGSEDPTKFISGKRINQLFLDNGKKQDQVYIFEGQPIDVFYEQFKKNIMKGDVVVIMASHNFGGLVEKIQRDGLKVN